MAQFIYEVWVKSQSQKWSARAHNLLYKYNPEWVLHGPGGQNEPRHQA